MTKVENIMMALEPRYVKGDARTKCRPLPRGMGPSSDASGWKTGLAIFHVSRFGQWRGVPSREFNTGPDVIESGTAYLPLSSIAILVSSMPAILNYHR